MKSRAAQAASPNPRDRLGAYRPDLLAALDGIDTPRFRHVQVLEHLARRPLEPFADATSLPGALRAKLDELGPSVVTTVQTADDGGGTTKLLLRLHDGEHVESVLLRHQDRVTVCVSTQVGCALGCRFCATGHMGFVRNLGPAEIVDQVRTAESIVAREELRVTNVVYMGMGEPLLNLWSTVASLRILADPEGRNMARRGLSVSTVGIPEGIRLLAEEEPQVNLALSLHAPTDELRNDLVPVNRRHPIAEVMGAAREHHRVTRRKLLVEYVLLRGINDAPDHARALAELIRRIPVTVNLLPFNPPKTIRGPAADRPAEAGGSSPGDAAPPARHQSARFKSILEELGVETTLRAARGVDIGAGCGQLAVAVERTAGRTPVRGGQPGP